MKFLIVLVALLAVASAVVVGGYNKVSCSDEMAKEAVEFAENELNARSNSLVQMNLVKCLSCESQVVAGINFRCRIKMELGGETQTHQVTVYRNLQGSHKLTEHHVEEDY